MIVPLPIAMVGILVTALGGAAFFIAGVYFTVTQIRKMLGLGPQP